ncbi:AAA family ATPase [Nocardioides nitrophenolicus]|uniref:AAA family ATPase n=1 Tax=Nocardioides nitrophenolicus TaxID=60489 RepID=UPI001956A330|nr:AAA family ATPase [Nocardioides nitrophenolicus]MBM7516023.1 putative ABC-type ATPase [Nocardioides nitrophenolicus]
MATPVLHLLAGPNGAGKSTFVVHYLQPVTHLPFVNADVIAAERWPGEELEHAYDASRAAAEQRQTMIAARRSFISETVFSHPSKVDLVAQATAHGYLVHLHVIMVAADTPVERVRRRVRAGGHDVPAAKVRERYARLWDLVATARRLADRTTCYDNSSLATPFRVVASYERGRLVGSADWPAWTPAPLRD